MRTNRNLTIAAAAACLGIAMWLIMRSGDTTSPHGPVSRDVATTSPPSDPVLEETKAQPRESLDAEADDPEKLDHSKSYWRVNPLRSVSVTVSKEVALERIAQGMPKIQKGAQFRELGRQILSIGDAYDRLMDTATFLSYSTPEIGMEHGDYYIFTQLSRENPDDAFLQAWLVGKADGKIYKWRRDKKSASK